MLQKCFLLHSGSQVELRQIILPWTKEVGSFGKIRSWFQRVE